MRNDASQLGGHRTARDGELQQHNVNEVLILLPNTKVRPAKEVHLHKIKSPLVIVCDFEVVGLQVVRVVVLVHVPEERIERLECVDSLCKSRFRREF